MGLVEKAETTPKPTFEELQSKAEADAGIPSDAELYGEHGIRPEPDEHGLAPTTPDESVVEAAAEPEPTVEEPAVEAAEETGGEDLRELKQKLGQLVNENAELRRQQEEFRQEFQARQDEPPLLTEATVGWFDELADQNPGEAAYWALQNRQPILYDRAMRTWYEQDPIAAGRYERQVEAAQMQQNILSQLQPQIAEGQQVAQQQQLERALKAVEAKHDDFAQVVGTLDAERAAEIIDGGFPAKVLEGLNGDQKAKEEVFETLYRWVKAEQADHLKEAAETAASRQAEEAKAAKREAIVASATTTTPDAVEETEEERMIKLVTARSSMRDAWEGQQSRRSGR